MSPNTLERICFSLALLVCVSVFTSCHTPTAHRSAQGFPMETVGKPWTERWVIGSSRVQNDLWLCYWIKTEARPQWSLCYEGIEGFDFTEGYEYVIKVKRCKVKNPPQDAGDTWTRLIHILSKEKKSSDVPPLHW